MNHDGYPDDLYPRHPHIVKTIAMVGASANDGAAELLRA